MMQALFLIICLLVPVIGYSQELLSFSSPSRQTTLVELYTSEGCSSCPPADRWLSTLKDDPRLWKEIIPIAFHVDYWNYLGWEDEYSRAEFTQRQYNYARWQNLKTVYTPGFLRNGSEWRAGFRNRTLQSTLGKEVGKLVVSVENNMITAQYQPLEKISQTIILHVAWLGFDLVTKVQSGENEGKALRHDFVSYNVQAITGTNTEGTFQWKFSADMAGLPEKKGAAFWVTVGDNPTPVQATGGWL